MSTHTICKAAGRAAIAVMCVLAVGCDQQLSPTGPDPDEFRRLKAAAQSMGFHADGMVDAGDRIVVEGDIMLAKAMLMSSANQRLSTSDTTHGLAPVPPRFQWMTDTTVSSTNVTNIHVDLSAISTSSAWSAAVRSAMAEWNAAPGSTIYFTEGTPADITVQFYTDDYRVIARADLPTGVTGKPGPRLQINTSSGFSLNTSQMLYNMVHELGHTVGFRHTNWQGYSCQGQYGSEAVGPGANQVGFTPQTDASSVMNGCSGTNSWVGFSHYDSVAAMAYNNFALTEANSGYPLVTFSYPRGATSVDFVLHEEESSLRDDYSRVVDAAWDTPYSTSSPVLDTDHAWGMSDCYQVNFPEYGHRTTWVLTVVYPQKTWILESLAHVQTDLTSPGVWSCN